METEIEIFFSQSGPKVRQRITEIFGRSQKKFAAASSLANDIIRRLAVFSTAGKTVRGSLVVLGSRLAGGSTPDGAVDAAAAVEIIHSSLLVHDDIMDDDWTRRGNPAIFAQYHAVAGDMGCADPLATAKSLAICAGDAGFFLALGAVAGSSLPLEIKTKAISMMNDEIAATALAQAEDVLSGAANRDPSLEQIGKVYNNKTARYTISLPLALGAVIAGAGEATVSGLEEYGENVGFVFQLRDDYLGFMGAEQEIGKPVGSDISQNKKTIIRRLLYDNAAEAQKEVLGGIFGNKNITAKEVGTVKNIVCELGVEEKVRKIQDEKILRAKSIAGALDIGVRGKAMLESLADFSGLRRS